MVILFYYLPLIPSAATESTFTVFQRLGRSRGYLHLSLANGTAAIGEVAKS